MTTEVKTRQHVNKNVRIKILAESNPKRKGTLAFDRFELYEDGMTVREYVEAGGRTGDVKYDVQAGHIELEID